MSDKTTSVLADANTNLTLARYSLSDYKIPLFRKGKVNFKYAFLFEGNSTEVMFDIYQLAMSNGYAKPLYSPSGEYMYFKGDIAIMLVAHVDTAHSKKPVIKQDNKRNILWSTKNGLGADDRAGVAAIAEIIGVGLKPHILLCNGEESGCIGARAAVRDIAKPNVNFIIELDRKGVDDAVFYECDNPEFEKYIESFGFKSSWGTFTDISVLCPRWGIAGVNLSIGYYNAHSEYEYLKIDEWKKTVDRVKQMLQNPPGEQFKYIEMRKYNYRRYSLYDYDYYDEYEDYASVKITPEDLASYFGGSELDWEVWLIDNKEYIKEKMLEAIKELIYSYPPTDDLDI